MDPKAFYDIILPAVGLRCMAVPYPKGGFFHAFGDSNAWLAEATLHIDTKRQKNVFFGCASFATPDSRLQSNVLAVRSFWLDIDCGEGKPYPDAKAGAKAVMEFAVKVGLARPFLVSSGRGIHAYWPMDADMDPATWLETARLFKAATQVEALQADASRTSDHSSVLRPPGCHHRKAEPRLIRVVVEGQVSRLDDFQERLIPYASHLPKLPSAAADMFLPEGGPVGDFDNTNDDLTAGVERPDRFSEIIANKCGVLARLRDTQGNVDQPTWYYSMGVMAATVDGKDLIHEWSKGHPGYSVSATDAKWRQAGQLPPTGCAKLRDSNFEICSACPHWGKIKSPIVLGKDEDAPIVVEVTKVIETAPGVWNEVKDTVTPPDGFKFAEHRGRRCVMYSVPAVVVDEVVVSPEGWEPLTDCVFYATGRLRVEDVSQLEFEMVMPVGQPIRRFVVDNSIIAQGKDRLAGSLGQQEIIATSGKGNKMDSYMQRWVTHLRQTAPQLEAHRSFGWTENDGFVLGDRCLNADGGENRAVLIGAAKGLRKALSPTGTLERWVNVIDKAYNAPGQEGYQFLVTCGFAAPLLSLLDQVNGVTVYAHSEGSGAGKTTAQRAGLSAWGDWDELQLAEGKTTANAMWTLMGAYSSLPVVYDELTNQKNDVASELVFSVSSGRAKQRLRSDGELRDNNGGWNTILMASGNTLLSEKLSQHRANAEAEISRLFEFTLSGTNHLTPNEANALFPQLKTNYGHAGAVFARYVVDNRDRVVMRLGQVQQAINEDQKITQVERYWSALLATVQVALSICRKLDILGFDQAALMAWMIEKLEENRGHRAGASSEPLDLLGTMLADMMPGVLVTEGEGDLRRSDAAAMVIAKPHGALVGRAIRPTSQMEVPVLLLNRTAVREWCNKKGVSAREVFVAAVRAGWAHKDEVKYSLGRGTIEYGSSSSHIPCWKLWPDKIAGAVSDPSVAQKMTVIKGGLSGPAAATDGV